MVMKIRSRSKKGLNWAHLTDEEVKKTKAGIEDSPADRRTMKRKKAKNLLD